MELNSLLWLEDSESIDIPESLIDDLNLGALYSRLAAIDGLDRETIHKMCTDEPTISYRQTIASDFMKTPALLDDLHESLDAFSVLHREFKATPYQESDLFMLINLVRVVETSANCLDNLRQTLDYHTFNSEGLKSLESRVNEIVESADFRNMISDLKAIRYAFSKVRSLEVSINMSPGMRPYEAQVTEVREEKYRFPQAFRRLAMTLENTDRFMGRATRHYVPVFGLGIINFDMMDEIEFSLKDHKTTLTAFLERYAAVDIGPFMRLLNEVSFYRSALSVFMEVAALGFPLTMPRIKDRDGRMMRLEKCYNLPLAVHLQEESAMVYNDFSMDDDGRIFILTGANRGGKTTFTQCVGQIQLLAQLGLPVPCADAEVSIVDALLSHFPVKEEETQGTGRFGKDCIRFREQYDAGTQTSLYLLNESFNGTSHMESMFVAKEAIKALKYKRARCIFNTHLLSLSKETEILNTDMMNDAPIVSLTAATNEKERAFIINRGAPAESSHAREVAESCGVSYSQLKARLASDEGGGVDE